MNSEKKDLLSLLEGNVENKDAYIKYFFKEIVGTNKEVKYSLLPNERKIYISVLKVENSKKETKNVIFYFLNIEETEKSFRRKINNELIELIQERVKEYILNKFGYLFVRAMLDIVLIKTAEKEISKDNYVRYRWTKNYEFKIQNLKSNIFGKEIEEKLIFVENTLEALKEAKIATNEVLNCVKAYYGEFDYDEECSENFDKIINEIESGEKNIIVKGPARSGKTMIAMRLLGMYENSSLLIMNSNFYSDLKTVFEARRSNSFPIKRIFHHDLKKPNGCWVSAGSYKSIIKANFIIIDEAQRLSGNKGYFNEIKKLINNEKLEYKIFLGDENQTLNEKFDSGMNEIEKELGRNNYKKITFSKSIGIPENIIQNINYLLGRTNLPKNLESYSIELYQNKDKFLNNFSKDNSICCLTHLPFFKNFTISSGEKVYLNAHEHKKNINDRMNRSNYIFSTYEIISREVETIYLYLPDEVCIEDDRIVIANRGWDSKYIDNHLYTIMSRATVKINIYVENEKLFNWFSYRLNKIKELSNIDNKEKEEIDKILQKEYNNSIYSYNQENSMESTMFNTIFDKENSVKKNKNSVIGKTVLHSAYGKGEIIDEERGILIIKFGDSIKRIASDHESILEIK